MQAELTYDFSWLTKLTDENYGDVLEALEEGVRFAMEGIQGEIQQRIPTGATGNMGREVVSTVLRESDFSIRGRTLIPQGASSYSYAYDVEEGQEAGTLHPHGLGTPLYEWTRVKFRTGAFKSKTNISDSAIASISYLIAKKIERVGTEGQHPFALGFQAALPEAERNFTFALEQALNRVFQ